MSLPLRYRRHLSFLGKRVSAMVALGAATGVVVGLIEIAFAYGLQAFLAVIGVLSASNAALPTWLPSRILPVFAFVAGIGLMRSLLQGFHYYVQGTTMEELQYVQRSRLLSWALHGESASASQVSNLFNARTIGTGSTVYSIQGLAVQIPMALLLTGTLFYMAPLVTVVAAGALSALAPLMMWWDRTIKQTSIATITHWDKTNNRLLMSIKNLLLLQIYGTQSGEEALAQDSLLGYRRYAYRMYLLQSFKIAAPQMMGLLVVCLIAITSKRWSLMAPGVLISYFYLFMRLIQTVSTINQGLSSLMFGLPHYEIMLDWWETQGRDGLALKRRRAEREGAQPEPFPASTRLGWRLRGVSFRYAAESQPVISNLDLDVAPGQTFVVTGPSGVGKSTLLGMLLGNLQPQSGTVETLLEDGTSLPLEKCRHRLLPRIGYVGPESFLFEGTIRQNVVYGVTGDPAEAEIKEALELAECHFVFELPKGLEHVLTEQGQGLSAGQKQRLSLARALLRKPTVLILDEATSNLDMETEQKLVETFARLRGQLTLVAVTHRQGLLKIADSNLNLRPELQDVR